MALGKGHKDLETKGQIYQVGTRFEALTKALLYFAINIKNRMNTK